MGAEPHTAHAPDAAPPTPYSAGFGYFRLFVLNSARLFSPPLGGDPEGAAPPPPPGEPPRAPARPPPETQVSEPAPPGLARAPAPQAAASAHGRQKAASPAPSGRPGRRDPKSLREGQDLGGLDPGSAEPRAMLDPGTIWTPGGQEPGLDRTMGRAYTRLDPGPGWTRGGQNPRLGRTPSRGGLRAVWTPREQDLGKTRSSVRQDLAPGRIPENRTPGRTGVWARLDPGRSGPQTRQDPDQARITEGQSLNRP